MSDIPYDHMLPLTEEQVAASSQSADDAFEAEEQRIRVREEVAEALEEARDKIVEAIELLEGAAFQVRQQGADFSGDGQISAYTIPHLHTWVDEDVRHQPGNISQMIKSIREDKDEDEDY